MGRPLWLPDARDRTALLYTVVLPRIGCENLERVSAREIIRFRQRYDEERRDFVDEIQLLATGLKARKFTSEVELQQYLEEYSEQITRKRRSFIATMRGNNIDTVLRSSAISAPLIAVAAAGALPQTGAAIGAALGMTAILYGSRRARRSDMKKDPAATYTFLMNRDFSTQNYMSTLAKIRMRRRWGERR
jgi:hypothetical protein